MSPYLPMTVLVLPVITEMDTHIDDLSLLSGVHRNSHAR
jgi:hypothetical protein